MLWHSGSFSFSPSPSPTPYAASRTPHAGRRVSAGLHPETVVQLRGLRGNLLGLDVVLNRPCHKDSIVREKSTTPNGG